jgi:tetratricopeptide (TPR) repeat protein
MHLPDIGAQDWAADAKKDGIAYSSVALFLQTARRAQADFDPDGPELKAIGEICQLVEGMPLGIEMAAAWIPVLRPKAFQGNFNEALQYTIKSEQRLIDLGYRGPFLARPYQLRGNILLDLGRYDEAQANAHQGLKIAKQYNNQQDIANTLGVLGSVSLVRADYETTLAYLTDSYERLQGISHFRAVIPLLRLVSAYRGVENLDQALQYLKIGITMLLKSQKGLYVGYALFLAAPCLTDMGANQLVVTVYTLAQEYPNIANSRWTADLYSVQMGKFIASLPNQTIREARERAEELDIWDGLRLILDKIETFR